MIKCQIGSDNDYQTLKSSSLFKNVDFEKIFQEKPPVAEINSPHKRRTNVSPFQKTPDYGGLSQGKIHSNSDDLTQNENKNDKSFNFSADKDRVILSGLVLKKCGWFFFKPRQLILNSKPRLVYYDPDSNQLRVFCPKNYRNIN